MWLRSVLIVGVAGLVAALINAVTSGGLWAVLDGTPVLWLLLAGLPAAFLMALLVPDRRPAVRVGPRGYQAEPLALPAPPPVAALPGPPVTHVVVHHVHSGAVGVDARHLMLRSGWGPEIEAAAVRAALPAVSPPLMIDNDGSRQ